MEKWFELILKPNKALTFVFILMLLFGVKSYFSVKKDVFPLTDIDTMILQVSSPGSSATDVEVNAVIPIEQKIKEISGIKSYNSISNPNSALVYLYLDRSIPNTQIVKDEIYRQLSKDNIENLGPDVDDVKIIDANPKLMPVLTLGVLSKNESSNPLDQFDFARKIQRKIEKLKGVSEVRTTALEDPEIHINIDPHKIKELDISIEDVWLALRNRNIHTNGGSLQSLKSKKTIITVSRFKSLKDIEDIIVVSNYSGYSTRIKDVAKVKKAFSEPVNLVRVNGARAVILQVVKREMADVLSVVKEVRSWIKKQEKSQNYELNILNDKGETISDMMDVVKSNALIGFLLVFITLFIFLDFKTSFWTAMGIPVTLLIVSTAVSFFEISINVITIGAVITVLGMLVDDGIVVAEAIYSSKERDGDIKDTAKEISKLFFPLVITILTTILAFLPLAQVGGMMGKFIKYYPYVISITLLASLFESLTLLPHHLKEIKKPKKKKWFVKLKGIFERSLNFSLRKKMIVNSLFIVFLIMAIGIGKKSFNRFVLIWDDSSEGIYVNVELNEGVSLYKTEEELVKLSSFIRGQIDKKSLKNIQITSGHHTVKRISSEGSHENWGQLLISLVPKNKRELSAKQIMSKIDKKLKSKDWPFTSMVLEEQIIGPNPGKGAEIVIKGGDEKERTLLVEKLKTFVKSNGGVKSIETTGMALVEELKLNFNFDEMNRLGISVSQVSQTIRAAFNGVVATEDPTIDYNLKYRVQLPESFKGNQDVLLSLSIQNKEKKLIPLKSFTTISTQKGKGQVFHDSGEVALVFKVQTNNKVITSRQMARKINDWWIKNKNNFDSLSLQIRGEARETKESIRDLIIAMAMSFAVIYMVITLLFNSYQIPFLILSTIPFGVGGALFAFSLHGIPLSFMGMVGIIGLSGILVNDSIILVSSFLNKTNRNAKEAALLRFRPILLTTVTTVMGLLPSVYGIGGDVKTLVPVVVAISYGLISGTLANLYFLPNVLSIWAQRKEG